MQPGRSWPVVDIIENGESLHCWPVYNGLIKAWSLPTQHGFGFNWADTSGGLTNVREKSKRALGQQGINPK